MEKAKCPECSKEIKLMKEAKVGELITCPYCKSILELVNQFPSALDWAEDPTVCSSRRIYSKMY